LETVTAYDISDGFYDSGTVLNMFPLKQAQQLPSALKNALVERLDGGYCFTQDVNRIEQSIVKADFNLDREEDYAVALQDNGGQYNTILILCYNPDAAKYYVAFTDSNYGLASLEPFNKDARIYIDSETLVKAPNNGIIYKNQRDGVMDDYNKYAIFYDPKSKEFKQCRQVPLSQYIYEGDDEGCDEEGDSVEEPASDTLTLLFTPGS
jgi:hypothetical protein